MPLFQKSVLWLISLFVFLDPFARGIWQKRVGMELNGTKGFQMNAKPLVVIFYDVLIIQLFLTLETDIGTMVQIRYHETVVQ